MGEFSEVIGRLMGRASGGLGTMGGTGGHNPWEPASGGSGTTGSAVAPDLWEPGMPVPGGDSTAGWTYLHTPPIMRPQTGFETAPMAEIYRPPAPPLLAPNGPGPAQELDTYMPLAPLPPPRAEVNAYGSGVALPPPRASFSSPSEETYIQPTPRAAVGGLGTAPGMDSYRPPTPLHHPLPSRPGRSMSGSTTTTSGQNLLNDLVQNLFSERKE